MKTTHKAGLSVAGAALAGVLIAHWEGMNLVAKHLPFDPPGVITVCGGITNYDWPWLKAGMTFTKEQCEHELAHVGERYADKVVLCVPSLPEMPPHRQAAIASFAVNLGVGKVCGTSIARDLNAGRIREACDAMVKYVYANGNFMKGLLNRRTDAMWGERPWCLRED
ncbi:lysozyme [Rhodopseudomonas palustris]|uniref:lysozyme n=1 Tax=Rhodopseudomonas palustris TaxID=1076 RepID=UPI000D1AD6F6|nr:lysozyme [Rhodopseudomonas palustris]AVT76650.1 lysozyme [Rhodopseudomonas palustris]